ncbi:MAG: hypothetical protein LC781_02735 [Actinobacteria bacterium]|nr:hypothetical protein [Actinomycetota bacterium]
MKKLMMLTVSAVPALARRDHRDRDHRHFFDRDGEGIAQESEQDADSGDVDQSFTVTGGGHNLDRYSLVLG